MTGTNNILESERNDMNSKNIRENSIKNTSGKTVVVIGGGLSDLASSLELCKQGSDSGLLAGSTEQSPQTITYGAGMYMAFVKAKNLVRNIELKKGKQ